MAGLGWGMEIRCRLDRMWARKAWVEGWAPRVVMRLRRGGSLGRRSSSRDTSEGGRREAARRAAWREVGLGEGLEM